MYVRVDERGGRCLPVAGYILFHMFMSKVKDNITYSCNDPIFNVLFGMCFLEACRLYEMVLFY